MRKKILFAPLWGILLILLFYGCRTNDEAIKNENIIQKAEYSSKTLWTEDEKYIKNIKEIFDKNANYDKFYQRHGTIYWDYAMTLGTYDESYLMVPIVKGGKVVEVMEATRNGKRVYFKLRESQNSVDFLETLVFTDKSRLKAKIDLGSPKASVGGAIASWDMQCKTITLVVGGFKETDPPIEKRETKCKFVWSNDQPGVSSPAEESNCADPSGDCSNGQGGAGYPYPEPDDALEEKIDISDLKSYPCAYSIAQELPNLNNTLAEALNKIFKNSNKYDITFKVSTILTGASNIDGETKGPNNPANHQGNFFKQTIYLNKDVLTNATKEYILVTMYHEVVHAYLNAELNRLGEQQFKIEYPSLYFEDLHIMVNGTQVDIKRFSYYKDHQEAAAFISTLQDILKSYNPNLSSETASVLSRAGMVDLTPNDQKINDRERGINKTLGTQEGTKC
jgi:hypothetical protein